MLPSRIFSQTPVSALILTLLLKAVAAAAASAPLSPAQLALFQGADRERILIEGAKKEGALTLYGSHTWYRTMANQFEKKYPFIKVTEYRTDGRTLIKRAVEEIRAGQYIDDVIDTTGEQMDLMKREGGFLEHYVAEEAHHPEDVKHKGINGFFYIGHYEACASLGFNTSLIRSAEAPETMQDLLNPRWKRKMSIVRTTTGSRCVGSTLETYGREYLE